MWDRHFCKKHANRESMTTPGLCMYGQTISGAFQRADKEMFGGAVMREAVRQGIQIGFKEQPGDKGELACMDVYGDQAGRLVIIMSVDVPCVKQQFAADSKFTALVGGVLCSTACSTVTRLVHHEMVHIMCYLAHRDASHGRRFKRFLKRYFRQSLLDHTVHMKSFRPSESAGVACMQVDTTVQCWDGRGWTRATIVHNDAGGYESTLRLPTGNVLTMSPSLIRCIKKN
jgi:hypothetical protein